MQRLSAVKTLLLKISVITGWVLPEYELKNILAEQFEKLLMENYAHFNVLEIEYAFRRFGTEIKDWGKEVNLSLITDVLSSYQARRSEATETALKSPLIEFKGHIWTDEDYNNEIREKIEAYYQFLRMGKKNPLWLPNWTEVLLYDKFIEYDTQVEKFFKFCLENNVKNIYEKQ